MYHCLYIVIVSLVMSTYNINFSAITTTTISGTTSTMPAMSNRAPSMANRLTLFRQDTLLALFYACCPTAWNTTKWYRTSKSLITAVTFIIIKQRQKWRRPRRQHQHIRHSHVFLSQRDVAYNAMAYIRFSLQILTMLPLRIGTGAAGRGGRLFWYIATLVSNVYIRPK